MSILKKIEIQNFKGYYSDKINFAPLTVLVGANSAGKSSLIQSILLSRKVFESLENKGNAIVKLNDKKDNYLELSNTKEIFSFHKIGSVSKTKKNGIANIGFKISDSSKGQFEIESLPIDDELSLKLEFKKNKNTTKNLNLFADNFHYLNSERIGPRSNFSMRGDGKLNVGFQGEYTSDVLWTISSKNLMDFIISEKKRWRNSFDQTIPDIGSNGLDKHIEAWFQFIFPNSEFRITPYPAMNTVQLSLRKSGLESFLNPNNMGFGLSYSLPVIVSGIVAKENELMIVENPEAHLHPKSQSRMGQFLAKMAGTGTQTIIETHSEHIVNGICLGVIKGFIKPKDVIINFFEQEKGDINITEINISKNGDFDCWPDGFFDQTLKDIAEIRERTIKT